jgi:hypothetical protein
MTLQKLANYHRALHGEELFSSSFTFRCPRTPQFLKFCAGSFQSSGDVVMQKFGGGIGVSFTLVPLFVPLRAIVSRYSTGMSVERGLWVIKARPFHLTHA